MLSRSIKTAAALLRANGVSLFRNSSGDFQIRLCNSARNAPYYFTNDLDDAVQTGLRMADERDAAAAKAAAAKAAYAKAEAAKAVYTKAKAEAEAAKAVYTKAEAAFSKAEAADAVAYAAAEAAADAYAAAEAAARDAQRRDGDEIEKRARETFRALYANAAR